MLWIVKKTRIEKKDLKNITADEVGQKAWGLSHLPKAWTCPFFVIGKELFIDVCHSEDEKQTIKEYLKNISQAVNALNLGNNLIIRSSGEKEGMEERGKYESICTTFCEIEEKLIELIKELRLFPELQEKGMPLIVQKYMGNDLLGHLSNERRVAKEDRDFVFEYRMVEKSEIETGKISLRNWRKKYDIEMYMSSNLIMSDGLKEALKIVCAYFYYQSKRVHLEFVCGYNVLYIVQCDYEIPNPNAVNPNEYDVHISTSKDFKPQILREIRKDDRGKYKKIDNVFIYQEVGEHIAPLYLLDDKNVLSELEKGNVVAELAHDLQSLTKHSLVIRTNVISDNVMRSQLSKRSNELRNYEDAKSFLLDATRELKEDGIGDYIFILHNFIPAKIAAFVNAKPMEQVVEMQMLWGLPEGLYYNSHDRIVVNTMRIDVNKMNKAKFVVSKNSYYKKNFIAPNSEGKWIVKELKPPYDWRCVMSDDEEIKDIAFRARKIAEHVGKELSIMWFIGIDENYYNVSNMPWYHEEYDRNSYYYTNGASYNKQYKKKYFYEKEVVIEKEEDLEKLRIMNTQEIGIVRIQPKDDKLLRSKEFIRSVGITCKEKGINILLEGAALAHSFYQLINTGATVLSSNEIKKHEENIEFNKLVRDFIPQIIRDNGETVKCVSIKGIGLIREIKNKIIEEAYEIFTANSIEETIEELADLEEVCIALEKNLNLVSYDRWEQAPINEGQQVVFEGAIAEYYKQFTSIRYLDTDISVSFERRGSNLQIDWILGEKKQGIEKNNEVENTISEKQRIIKHAFKLLKAFDVEECQSLLKKIREDCRVIQENCKFSREDVERIRLKKASDKGTFDKGYILLKTLLSNHEQENSVDIFPIGEPVDVYDLQLNSRIDVDNINGNRILIRLTMPIYIRQTEWIIDRKKVHDFLGRSVKIRIVRDFWDTKIVWNVMFIEEQYQQLKLEL